MLRRTLAIPIVLLVLLAAVLAVEVLYLTSSLRLVDHTDRVIGDARLANRYMVDMESSLRGYELSHDPSFLKLYNEAKSQLPSRVDELIHLTSDNPGQQSRVKELRDLDTSWMAWADQEIAAHQLKAPTQDEILFGARLMDEIRSRQAQVITEEQRLLGIRSRRATILGRLVMASSIVLSLLVAALLLTLTRREFAALTSTYERHLDNEAERTHQLQESREWFQITLDSLGEAVLATDASGTVTYSNRIAQELTGWNDGIDPRGRPLRQILRLVDARTRSDLRDLFEMVQRDARAITDNVAMIDRQGREFPVELNGAPILNDRNQLAGVVIVFRDVTERRQTEQTLRSNERLMLAGRLSATIAHEIRNPLDTVTNLVYLMQHDNHQSPTSIQYLEMASEELARITQITGQLLTFHREANQPVPVSLEEVLESVLTVFAPQIRRCKVDVERNFEDVPPVRGFPGELRQVFSNLVGNALDAMPHGGRLIVHLYPSSLREDPTRKGVRVTVLDTGQGISRGVRKNLFAPFYTTKGEKGTGLGLWVSRGIIDKHEGSIHLTSTTRLGRSGTAFSVFLPYEQFLGKLDVIRSAPATHV